MATVTGRPQPTQRDLSSLSRLYAPWWELAARFVPARLAPNVITLSGVVVVAVPSVALFLAAPTFRGEVPAALHVAQALGIFAFQTLDALDGKQARRTQSSSPLGSFLDHACDIFTMQMVLAATALATQCGLGFVLFFLLSTTLLNNTILHWETLQTGELTLGNGTSITEAQTLAIAIHLGTAVVGAGFWSADGIAGGSRGEVFLLAAVIGVGFTGMFASFRRGFRGAFAKRAAVARLFAPAAFLALSAPLYFSSDAALDRGFALLGMSLLGARRVSLLVYESLSGEVAQRAWLDVGVAVVVLALLQEAPAHTRLVLAGFAAGAAITTTWTLVGRVRTLARTWSVPVFTLPARSKRS